MRGRIESGQLVTLAPIASEDVEVDQMVFVRWKGNFLLHIVKQVSGDEILIGNNVGKTNGWIVRDDVLGVVTNVED